MNARLLSVLISLVAILPAPAQSIFQVVSTPNANQPYPAHSYLTAAAASSPTDIWAVGASSIHFDGTQWTAFPAL